jgi:hypothetical protein
MNRTVVVGVAAVCLVALAGIALVVWFGARPADALPQTYRNSVHGFSLRIPADYTVTEAPNTNPREENGVADIIEFSDASSSVQLTIIYASYAHSVLTAQSLLSSYPWLAGIATQPFPIAPGTVGLAVNNNPALPDAVSDVWFGKNGYLYELTAISGGELLPIAHTVTLF